MAGLTRKVHPVANFVWKKASEAIPDVQLQLQPPPELGQGNGAALAEPMCLVFVDPQDGETHVYLFAEEGRKKLIETLTGGIVIPDR